MSAGTPWQPCAGCGEDIQRMAWAEWMHVRTKTVYCLPVEYARPLPLTGGMPMRNAAVALLDALSRQQQGFANLSHRARGAVNDLIRATDWSGSDALQRERAHAAATEVVPSAP